MVHQQLPLSMVCFPGEQVPGPIKYGQAQEESLHHMCREGCSPHLALQQKRAPFWAAPCCPLHNPSSHWFWDTEKFEKKHSLEWKSLVFPFYREWGKIITVILVHSGSIREEDVFLSTCEKAEVLLEKAFSCV